MIKTKYHPYPKYKPSGIDWLGNIPEDWEVKKLKYLFEDHKGGVWGGESRDDQNDLVCFRVADFDFCNFDLYENDLTIRNIPEQYKDRILTKGDILLEKSGGGEKQLVGRVVRFDLNIRAVCSNFIEKLTPLKEHSAKYVTYLMGALYFNNINYRSIKQTTGIQNLDLYFYLSETALLPKKETQEFIADFLDRETEKIDQIIEKNNRLVELLKEKRQAVITRAVTKGLDPKAKMKPSGIDWLGNIPEDWEIKRLRFVLNMLNGNGFPENLQGKIKGDFPFYKVSDIGGNQIYLENANNYVDLIEVKTHHWKIIPKKSIVTAKIGAALSLNHRKIVLKDCLIDNNILAIYLKTKMNLMFIYYLFKVINFDWYVNPGAVPSLNINQFLDEVFPLPNDQEQKNIVDFLDRETDKIDGAVRKLQLENEKLQEFRQALISSAVTGKIRV